MFAFATLQMVGNAYDVFLYIGGYLEPWSYSRDNAFYGLNLGAAISFALAILLQDSMLVSLTNDSYAYIVHIIIFWHYQ
jgi:surfactin synthase thioesterase subunit